MTSPSESATLHATPCETTGMPERLLGEAVRGVSRLEFYSLDWAEAAPVKAERDSDGAEESLKEEVATLGDQLRLQAEQMTAGIERARSEAKIETRREMEKELEEKIARERSGILKVCEELGRERMRYFAAVEAEVVKLSLAIAARVLHREVKLDPLLLAGVVRVALDKMAEGSTAVLRVPVSEVENWRQVLADEKEGSPQLMGDDRLSEGECVIDTNVGSVELGVGAQLKEIERGFLDLLQQRPM